MAGLVPLGGDRAEIAETLGPPADLTFRIVPNRHVPGVQDTLFTLYYPGLEIHLHRPGGGRDLLSAVDVSDDRYLRYPGLGIGTPSDRVRRVLGSPDDEAAGTLTYRCPTCMGAEQWIEIVLREDRISRIRFNFYVD